MFVAMATGLPRLAYNGKLAFEDMVAKSLEIEDVVRKSKLSQRTVYRFFSGELQTSNTAKRIAKALGYSTRRYLIRSEEPQEQAAAS